MQLAGAHGGWIIAALLVTALGLVVIGALLIWSRRWRADPEEPAPGAAAPRVCRTCARRYPAEALYCAVDASPLSWVEGAVTEAPLGCRRCERLYSGGERFCAFDAEALVRVETDDHEHHHPEDLSGSAMICPVCAARYEEAAIFCGRDGTRLCSLN